jgi:hypothetical protein
MVRQISQNRGLYTAKVAKAAGTPSGFSTWEQESPRERLRSRLCSIPTTKGMNAEPEDAAAPSAARRCAGPRSSRRSTADRPKYGLHNIKGGTLNGGGVQTHSVAGFAWPDFRKRLRWALNHPLRLPAELKCRGDWQISAPSAKIVSGFSLRRAATGWPCVLRQREGST